MNHGLALFHSNDLEALVDALLNRLAPLAEAGPLRPVDVVVSHPGLGRWLSLYIAERRGIAANLNFEMPAQFVWRWARTNLPDLPAGNPFEPDALLWHVFELLGEPSCPPELATYLEGDTASIRRYQLAQRTAEVFARYALQRADWLLAWRSDRQPSELREARDEPWQRQLYSQLEQRMGQEGVTGPAATLEALVGWQRRLADGHAARLPDQALLFGVSYLPPLFLDFFAALGRRGRLDLFLLNPTREYWERGVSERTRLRRELRDLRAGREADQHELFEVDHPLLAALGRHGAAFLQRLLDLNLPDALTEHEEPAYPLGTGDTHLGRLQASLRDLDPALVCGPESPDGSIQVHSCHSALREVQVLYDRLLVMLDEDPSLKPRDVVVLAPDIQRYAPYIRAVFRSGGAAGELPSLPYNLSDRRPLDVHPLVAAFSRLLSLPADEFEVDEVMALAEVPAVARRMGLEPHDLSNLRRWLVQSGVRWGLDSDHRRGRGGSGEPYNSWQRGLDRMLVGFAVDSDVLIADEVLPLASVEGQTAEAAGCLAWLVRELARLREAMLRGLTVDRWVRLLTRGILEGLLAVDPGDPDERLAMQHVLDAIDGFRRHAAGTSTKTLPWTVVREHLDRLLSNVPGRQAFLAGGVTFANMVPMRSIPARVVCILGMDDAAFPRRTPPAQFDLTRRSPRLGDRSQEEEDRYLFLECLLSARDVFYLSYVGQSENDGEAREPSPLIKELRSCCRASRVPVTQHPMQPFGRGAFDPDSPQTQSPQSRWMPAARVGDAGDRRSEWFQPPDWQPKAVEVASIEPAELLRFFRNPARYYLEERLGLYLRDTGLELDSEDPVDPDGLALYDLRRRLMEVALANHGSFPPDLPDARFRAPGDVPPGDQGAEKVLALAEELAPFVGWVYERFGEQVEPTVPVDLDFELATSAGRPIRVSGAVDLDRELRQWNVGSISAVRVCPVLVAHLLAHAGGRAGEAELYGFNHGKLNSLRLPVFPEDVWKPWLLDLLDVYREGLSGPLPFFPKTALAYEELIYAGKSPQVAVEKVEKDQWRGNQHGEGADPYYALMTRGWSSEDLFGEYFRGVARRVFRPLLKLGDGQAWSKEPIA
ncbi:MAG: exodeoxyribonuclease V subunit gamma [Xanthomonadales bacterium]|nr:exodeoxyribonuclease V subunit gamma [Xanthomonadales bacterium]